MTGEQGIGFTWIRDFACATEVYPAGSTRPLYQIELFTSRRDARALMHTLRDLGWALDSTGAFGFTFRRDNTLLLTVKWKLCPHWTPAMHDEIRTMLDSVDPAQRLIAITADVLNHSCSRDGAEDVITLLDLHYILGRLSDLGVSTESLQGEMRKFLMGNRFLGTLTQLVKTGDKTVSTSSVMGPDPLEDALELSYRKYLETASAPGKFRYHHNRFRALAKRDNSESPSTFPGYCYNILRTNAREARWLKTLK